MSLAQKLPLNIQGKNIIRDLPTKLRKRALLSQRQAQRHRKREDESKELAKKSERIFEGAFRSQLWREKVRTERKSRREDLISGPLAPRRDYGNKAATYGSLSVAEIFGTEKYQYKNYGLVAGDRVVIIKAGHPDLGKIARVKEIREKAEECVLDGLNKVDITVPSFMLIREADKSPLRPYEAPVPLKDVRLVAPLVDPETGTLRDVVINELSLKKLTTREHRGIDKPTRIVAGLDPAQIIPYPEEREPDYEDQEIDTLRIDVEERTWVPTMHTPPMPTGVIDELRNKYGKFRYRHDEEYIQAAIKEEEEKAARKRTGDKMMTPLKERRRAERKERKAMGKPKLSNESLAAVGELMQRSRIAPREADAAV